MGKMKWSRPAAPVGTYNSSQVLPNHDYLFIAALHHEPGERLVFSRIVPATPRFRWKWSQCSVTMRRSRAFWRNRPQVAGCIKMRRLVGEFPSWHLSTGSIGIFNPELTGSTVIHHNWCFQMAATVMSVSSSVAGNGTASRRYRIGFVIVPNRSRLVSITSTMQANGLSDSMWIGASQKRLQN